MRRHVRSVHKDIVAEGPCQCPTCRNPTKQKDEDEDDEDEDEDEDENNCPPPDCTGYNGPRYDGPGGGGSGPGLRAA